MDPRTIRQLLSRFPITESLDKAAKKLGTSRRPTEAVSGELWDSIFQRLSPYLSQSSPIDILDLWPNCGLRSAKANELLKPRRHVLVSANEAFNPLLKPFLDSTSGSKLITEPIYQKEDWREFLEAHFPEQVSPIRQKPGQILRNDTLLVLASPPRSHSKSNHYTPARWWLRFLEDCIQQTGLNSFGTVRVLASMPYSEVPSVLPRCAPERKRIATLLEAVNLHTFEVASSEEPDIHLGWREWDSIQANKAQVAERAAAQNVLTPPNRERPPLEKIPPFAQQMGKDVPYIPRAYLAIHKQQVKTMEELDGVKSDKTKSPAIQAAARKRAGAKAKLVQGDKIAYTRHILARKLLDIDDKGRQLARAAADPNETPQSLKALDDEIASLWSEYNTQMASTHYTHLKNMTNIVDDDRLSLASRENGSQLIWERRPFEPLHIHRDEVWPKGDPISMIYFEANETPPVLQQVTHPSVTHEQVTMERFYALLSVLTNTELNVGGLKDLIFPLWSANDLIQAVPSLAFFATKRLKPGCGPLPLNDPTSDPAASYQDNLEYDLSDLRLHVVSVESFMGIAIEYEKLEDKLPISQFTRLIGGTFTTRQMLMESGFRRL
ncbi:unnamed protein product [Penicillium olsonii]|nr:unnamed protein product [Penicillium olsonii]CAG7929127.1 unnamed protein product [Penicillium olsonii]